MEWNLCRDEVAVQPGQMMVHRDATHILVGERPNTRAIVSFYPKGGESAAIFHITEDLGQSKDPRVGRVMQDIAYLHECPCRSAEAFIQRATTFMNRVI